MLASDIESASLLGTTSSTFNKGRRPLKQQSSFSEASRSAVHPQELPLRDIQSSGIGLMARPSSYHQQLSSTTSVPLAAMASSVVSPLPSSIAEATPAVTQQRVLGGNRPTLRGGGGHLAGVRLYRQRTATSSEEPAAHANNEQQGGPSPARQHARTHSVFSTRSVGNTKDKGSLRYRRIQNKIYNILERPKDCRAISYHVLSFAVVFACLVLSIVQSADDSINLLNEISMSVELLMLLWFTSEYVLRIWSAGCRSKYQSFLGRLRFARRPLCIIDAVVIVASVAVVVMNASSRISQAAVALLDGSTESQEQPTGGGNMVPALRGLRFFQIMRMMRLDRRGSSWRLLSSVVWAHRQELFTAIYTGFLVLIFASFAMYIAERETNEKQFKSYADALWWGVITLCTVGYGDKVPQTAIGRVIGSCCAMIGISFFALPPGILGSGLALKVQQQQRQKHQIRRRVPAAMLIQALWRLVGTETGTVLHSTWHYYITHQRRSKQLLGSGAPAQLPWAPTSVTDRLQMAAGRLVNVSRRSFRERGSTNVAQPPGITLRQYNVPPRHSPEDSPTRERSQSADPGPTGPLTPAQCNVIRAVRRMKFLVCRRKLRESMRPYDVKDVIEQYSSGHAEILSRLRQLQYRMDDMTLTLAGILRQQPHPHQATLNAVGREYSSPPAVGMATTSSNQLESPIHLAPPPHLSTSDEEQSLQWRMHMMDRKLDMVMDLIAGRGVVAQGPPTIVVSHSGQCNTPTHNTAEIHRPPMQQLSRSLPQTPLMSKQQKTEQQQKDTSASTPGVTGGLIDNASLQPHFGDTTEAISGTLSSTAAAVSSETTISANELPIIVAGIVLDNESSV